MEAPNLRYIITRALFLLGTVFIVLYGISFSKKWQRKSAILADLKSITTDSSYFQQFYAADAQKTLIRAVGLMAEANQLGVPPEQSIDRLFGIGKEYYQLNDKPEEPQPRERIIRTSLSNNYENFRKLGYKPDFQTLSSMKEGVLPLIPDGPQAGQTPVIVNLIDPALSAGLDKVIANLEIRPPGSENSSPTDVETAAAKGLANNLAEAHIIEESVAHKIVVSLSGGAKK